MIAEDQLKRERGVSVKSLFGFYKFFFFSFFFFFFFIVSTIDEKRKEEVMKAVGSRKRIGWFGVKKKLIN